MNNNDLESQFHEGPSDSQLVEESLKRLEHDFSPERIEKIAKKWAPHYASLAKISVPEMRTRLVQDLTEHVRLVRLTHARESRDAGIDELLRLGSLAQEIVKRWHEAYFDGRHDPYAHISTPVQPRPSTARPSTRTFARVDKTKNVVSKTL